MTESLCNEGYLDKYTHLLVKRGVNIQPGQQLIVNCPVDCAFFARKLMESAYRAGASNVHIRWHDDTCSRIHYLMADGGVFDRFPGWSKLMLDTLSRQGAAVISVMSADPESLKGVDPNRLSRANRAQITALRNYQERQMSNRIRWCIACVPCEAWAKKVFPDTNAKEAILRLWREIFAASRVDENDVIQNWTEHTAKMQKNAKALNTRRFKSLHFQNSAGTDLTVNLPDGHIWIGGGDTDKAGVSFLPNIPTEEIFTAPHRSRVEGTVVGTMPNVFRGNLIEGFAMTFKAGRVISCGAKKGKAHLNNLIHDIPNMDRLGEVALVPHDSPISKTGVLFYNTLFDENASCHLALGSAAPGSVKGGGLMTSERRKAIGLNNSDSHHDFMFGSPDLSVTGTTPSGETVPVFRGGNFVL